LIYGCALLTGKTCDFVTTHLTTTAPPKKEQEELGRATAECPRTSPDESGNSSPAGGFALSPASIPSTG
jgi:hypothetical protein